MRSERQVNMSDNLQLTLRYEPGVNDSDAERILNLLNPILRGAKIREKQNHPPYKHIYITPRNGSSTTK